MPSEVVGARLCNACGREKRAERFYRSNPYTCKKCLRDALRESRRNNPAQWTTYARRYALKRLYGITPEQYEQMLARQDRRCAICGTDHVRRRGVNNFSVDHNHSTQAIRGLLCHNCNRGLGHFKDSQELMIKAIDYIRKFEEVEGAQEYERNHEGVQGEDPAQRVEDRPSGEEPETGDCDRLIRTTPDGERVISAEDRQTGISIRFVKQYDVDKDAEPRRFSHAEKEHWWDEAVAYERAEAEACGRPYEDGRARDRFYKRITP